MDPLTYFNRYMAYRERMSNSLTLIASITVLRLSFEGLITVIIF